MTLPDLLERLTELAERQTPEGRSLIFEALRRLRHEGGYVVKVDWQGDARVVEGFSPPTLEMERWWGIRS